MGTGNQSNGWMSQTVSTTYLILTFKLIEHFIVWMRTAGLPNFRKLYGKIDKDLKAGTYYLHVNNNYDVSSFNGNKSFVMSTTNILGG